MKQIVLLAGAAALGFAAPAFAKPGHGHGHGHGHGSPHAVKGEKIKGGKAKIHDYDDRYGRRWGGAVCPPGLAKKPVPCVPPGHAKQDYRVGQRFPYRYGTLWNYRDIPYDVRRQYGFNPYDRYYYDDGYIYRVDPRTRLIEQAVLAALFR